MKNKKVTSSVIALIGVLVLSWFDQWTKLLITQNFELYETLPIIDGVFQLKYIQNPGMAWSMLEGKQLLFSIFTPIICFFIVKLFICLPWEKKYTPIRVICIFLVSGAIGNLIDRVWGGETLFTGGVIDFFDFCLINFPVFNVADCYVSCSVIVLFILLLFKYKDEDFDVIINSCIKFKKKED